MWGLVFRAVLDAAVAYCICTGQVQGSDAARRGRLDRGGCCKTPRIHLMTPSFLVSPSFFLTSRFFGFQFLGCNPPLGLHPSPQSGGQTANEQSGLRRRLCAGQQGGMQAALTNSKGVVAPRSCVLLNPHPYLTSSPLLNHHQNISLGVFNTCLRSG